MDFFFLRRLKRKSGILVIKCVQFNWVLSSMVRIWYVHTRTGRGLVLIERSYPKFFRADADGRVHGRRSDTAIQMIIRRRLIARRLNDILYMLGQNERLP